MLLMAKEKRLPPNSLYWRFSPIFFSKMIKFYILHMNPRSVLCYLLYIAWGLIIDTYFILSYCLLNTQLLQHQLLNSIYFILVNYSIRLNIEIMLNNTSNNDSLFSSIMAVSLLFHNLIRFFFTFLERNHYHAYAICVYSYVT